MDNAQKLAVLPMWVIDRIKEEMRLSPAVWQTITAAVEQAEVPQKLPCEVKLPPSTVIGKGVPVSTLMLAIAQRKRYPVHARAFVEQPQGEPVAWRGLNELGEVVTEWVDGVPPSSMVDLSGNSASFASIEQAYTRAHPGEVESIKADRDAFAQNAIDLKAEVDRLRAALKFYADKEHFYHGDDNWDTVSGEPANILWHAEEPYSVEDGWFARQALSASAEPSAPPQTINGHRLNCKAVDDYKPGECSCGLEPSAPTENPSDCLAGFKVVEVDHMPDDAIKFGAKVFKLLPSGKAGKAGKPRAPVERDELTPDEINQMAFEEGQPVEDGDGYAFSQEEFDLFVQRLLDRAALERNQSALVAQLQADLTERDERIDALSTDASRYRWLRSRDLETISQGGVFAGLTPDNLVLNEETLDQAIDAAMAKPKCRHCGDTGQIMVSRSGQAEDGNAPIMEPCEDCDRGMPDLASRPEERGTPETEPCSGCGTPGWTGACNKCVPY